MPFTSEYARRLARNVSPASMRATKSAIYRDLHRDVGSSVEESERLLREMTRGREYREGVSALLEKRDPVFR